MSSTEHRSAQFLTSLGWGDFFRDQMAAEEAALAPMRIATVHRARISAMAPGSPGSPDTADSPGGPVRLLLPHPPNTSDFAVGDWVLVEAATGLLVRRLERRTLLRRRIEGGRGPQLIAANVDTLFITTSCNADLNPARLERYLALANEAGTAPVVLLTKADQVDDPAPYLAQVTGLQRDLPVLALNARAPEARATLAPWCGPGQTVALVGSSGVGKSSLLNTLAGKSRAEAQATGAIRASDAKGRHTTTARSLHPIPGGGWVIDTPGMRTLHVSDITAGLEQLFAEITELAPQCRFRDCTHMHEPGCAVQAAIAEGTLDPARLARWHKLSQENLANTPVETGARGNKSLRPRGPKR